MLRPADYLTLEDLFHNNEDLSGWEILRWLRFYHKRTHIEPHEVLTLQGLYEGWKSGIFKIVGDNVVLRKWESN